MFVPKAPESENAKVAPGAIKPEWAFANPRSKTTAMDSGGHGACACGGGCPACKGNAERRDGAGAPNPDDELPARDIGGFGDLVGPPQFSVTAATRTGPTWSSCRGFNLIEDWSTDGRDGFILQEIVNANSITNCADGSSVAAPSTPRYWEAWPVDASGNIGDGGADQWSRAQFPGTQGFWSMTGHVGFVPALDSAAGFSRTAVPDANGLLATTTEPTGLYMATLHRFRGGIWNCCTGTPYHLPL
ncbi:MAG: hypothetical protein IAE86_00290 [Burkholderiaceae bacterium]|nr:hypothetical protein [Burkholderiaceae bacterium]